MTAVQYAQELINLILYYIDEEDMHRINEVFNDAKQIEKKQFEKLKDFETFDKNKLTAASNKLPLGALIKVTNKDNGKSVVVKINDCGKMKSNVIDLSESAFKKIAKLSDGRIKVSVSIIKWK